MPLYEYHCRQCGKSFEMLRKMQDADRDVDCPECESEDIERLLSTFASTGCSSSGSGKFT